MKKIQKKILLFLTVCLMTGCLVFPAALADTMGGGRVSAGLINLRSAPGMSGAITGAIPKNSFVLIEGMEGSWYQVAYHGKTGYAASAYISASAAMDGVYNYSATVRGSNVRLRSMPNTEAAVLGMYNSGEKLTVLGVSGNWLKVAAASGAAGYIRSDLVSYTAATATASPSGSQTGTSEYPWGDLIPLEPENVPGNVDTPTPSVPGTVSSSAGEQIVATAMRYLGCPYQWGGMSPSGFDCSGFVNYVFNQHGYTLERVAQSIYNNSGVFVNKNNLQPGDILCFGYSAGSIDHVGIYIGNNQFIHAADYNTGVKISSLSSTYFASRFIGAKRVV